MSTTPLERAITYAVLLIASAFALYPMGLIVYTAVQPDQIGAGAGFDPGNFATAWDRGHFGSYLQTSVIVSVSVVLISTLLACLAGYAFGTMRFRGSSPLFYLLLLGLMVPS
ncbi:MAG: carbohydrate ABC transporter permease, partial [Nocardioidaceae bacterium]